MTSPDAYFAFRKKPNFLVFFKISLILLDVQLGANMLENAPGWNRYSNWVRKAAIHPISMRLKYDEGVTLFLKSEKNLWDLATGGAPDWSTCAFSTSKIGKFADPEAFTQNTVPDFIWRSCKYGGRLVWCYSFIILRYEVIPTNRTKYKRFLRKVFVLVFFNLFNYKGFR